MVDGEVSVMMMAMISSNSPSRQGAKMEFLVPGLGFLVAVTQRNSFVEKRRPLSGFRSEAFIQCGGEVEEVPEAASPPLGVARGGPAPRHGVGPSRLFSVSYFGFVSLREK